MFFLGIYYVFLAIIYVRYIVPVFNYEGFDYCYDNIRIAMAVPAIMLMKVLMSKDEVLALYHNVVILFVFIPSMVLFSFGCTTFEFYIVTVGSCVIVLLVSRISSVRLPRAFEVSLSSLTTIFVVVIIVYFVVIISLGGLKYFNLDLLNVYVVRSMMSSGKNALVYGYISPVIGKIIAPLTVVIAAVTRSRSLMVFGVLSSFFIFAFTTIKAPLFYPIVIYLLLLMKPKNYVRYMNYSLVFLLIFASIDLELIKYRGTLDFSFGWIGALIAKRILMLPSYLNSCYIEFFLDNPRYYWSSSILTLDLVEAPFTEVMPRVIGLNYYGTTATNANTGWIGSGFGNAGWFGVLLYSILIGFLVATFAAFAQKLGRRLVVSTSFVIYVVIVTSTDLTTSLLTHGLLVLLLIYVVFPRSSVRWAAD